MSVIPLVSFEILSVMVMDEKDYALNSDKLGSFFVIAANVSIVDFLLSVLSEK